MIFIGLEQRLVIPISNRSPPELASRQKSRSPILQWPDQVFAEYMRNRKQGIDFVFIPLVGHSRKGFLVYAHHR